MNITSISPSQVTPGLSTSVGGIGQADGHFEALLQSVRQTSTENAGAHSSEPSGIGRMFQQVNTVMGRMVSDAAMAPQLLSRMDIESAHQWNMSRVMNAHVAQAMFNTTLGVASGVKSGLQQLLKNQ